MPKTAPRKPSARRRKPASRWRRAIGWVPKSHPVAKATVGLVGPVVAIVSLLLALGVISPASASEQLAKGADHSLAKGSSALRLAVVADVDGQTVGFTASGSFDYQARRGSLLYNFDQVKGLEREIDVEGRFIDGAAFIQLPADAAPPGGPTWAQVDPAGIDQLLRDVAEAEIAPAATLELAVLTDVSIADPSGMLRQLAHAGKVEKVGHAEAFGVPTDEYRGTLPVAGGRASVQATAWIDGDGLVRRLELSGGAGGRITTTLELWDYGTRVRVVKPQKSILASDLYGRVLTK